MMQKIKEHWDVVLSAGLSILSVGMAIWTTLGLDKSVYMVAYIIALATESILAWLLLGYVRCKLLFLKEKEQLETEKADKDNQIQDLQEKLNTIDSSYQNVIKKRELECGDAFKIIFLKMKDISKLNNDFCTKIPNLTEKAFKVVEKIQQRGFGLYDEGVYEEINNSIQELSLGLFDLYKRYTSIMLRYLIELFEAYLKLNGIDKHISATVKLFDKPFLVSKDRTNDFHVYTAFRDNNTYRECPEREIGKIAYTIDGNIDFQTCLSSDRYYINNVKRNDGAYKNEHADFDQYYNCACVVSIRVKMPDNTYKVMGYLCCDCLNDNEKGVFNEELARVQYAIAQTYGTFLETLHSNWLDRVEGENGIKQSFLEVIYENSWRG